jgi:hypothetical protein
MRHPATKLETAKPQNIHIIAGSYSRGLSASEMADPKALVSRYMDWTKDFMDGGALVYAYSRPVTEAKISEIPMSMYAPVCVAIWMLLPWITPFESLAASQRG